MPKNNEGKGLSALFGANNISLVSPEDAQKIPIDLIVPNPYQPRKEFNEEKLNDLKESILKHGVLQPILVRKKIDNTYELVAGERRLRASKLAGLTTIPANIRSLTDRESLEIALIENIQREDINPIEVAVGYKKLIEQFSYTQEDLSKVIGKNRSTIANTMRLLSLPNNIVDLISQKVLSEGHGRTILSVPEEKRDSFAKLIVDKKLSVRQAEEEALNYKISSGVIDKKVIKINPLITNAKKLLSIYLNTKVKITETNGKGKIVIPFENEEEMNNIINLIKEKK